MTPSWSRKYDAKAMAPANARNWGIIPSQEICRTTGVRLLICECLTVRGVIAADRHRINSAVDRVRDSFLVAVGQAPPCLTSLRVEPIDGETTSRPTCIPNAAHEGIKTLALRHRVLDLPFCGPRRPWDELQHVSFYSSCRRVVVVLSCHDDTTARRALGEREFLTD